MYNRFVLFLKTQTLYTISHTWVNVIDDINYIARLQKNIGLIAISSRRQGDSADSNLEIRHFCIVTNVWNKEYSRRIHSSLLYFTWNFGLEYNSRFFLILFKFLCQLTSLKNWAFHIITKCSTRHRIPPDDIRVQKPHHKLNMNNTDSMQSNDSVPDSWSINTTHPQQCVQIIHWPPTLSYIVIN